MGRLFWKFFFIFWLAQMFTVMGVSMAVWALRPELSPTYSNGVPPEPPPYPGMLRPPPGMRGDMPPPRPRNEGLFPPLLPILAGSLASLLFAGWLAWYFARPIRNLRTAFDAVANGRLETRIGFAMDGRNDELADLGYDFDRMAARLQGLMESQRRLLHDVSHELRSPLARLQAATDLMRQQPERAAELIAQLERDTGRMDALVGELLTLARLDSGMTGCMDEALELRDILDHIADDARFEAEAKSVALDAEFPAHIPLRGNPELLFRALENVVRNAVLHSPSGKRIGLKAQPEAGGWRITVLDHGPGVPEDELDSLFEPFFRSRNSASQTGYGLGLAITRRVVQAHGGTVTAANREEGGLAVSIKLPGNEPKESN